MAVAVGRSRFGSSGDRRNELEGVGVKVGGDGKLPDWEAVGRGGAKGGDPFPGDETATDEPFQVPGVGATPTQVEGVGAQAWVAVDRGHARLGRPSASPRQYQVSPWVSLEG